MTRTYTYQSKEKPIQTDRNRILPKFRQYDGWLQALVYFYPKVNQLPSLPLHQSSSVGVQFSKEANRFLSCQPLTQTSSCQYVSMRQKAAPVIRKIEVYLTEEQQVETVVLIH